ncbi:cyclophilin-like domain-containing protein [Limtongia smithiae]|uniref:cyclophilin-like domain-containing protein n=1 Tax=Limtongia smithiae TaxID=1125753 RepID=UPI0034CD8E79
MGKNTDKLFITHSEWSGPDKHGSSGGVSSAKKLGGPRRRLAFTHCALSMVPYGNNEAVCDAHGNIFGLTNIQKYLDTHTTNPITNEPLTMSDLIPLHFARNELGEVIDPVTFKVFAPDSSHMVCVRPSGNVYSFDTIDTLNVKAKNWTDIVTGQKFRRQDIITLQDPMNVNVTLVAKAPSMAVKRPASETAASIDIIPAKRPTTSTTSALPFNASSSTTGRAATSLTSTAITPYTRSDRQLLSEEEFMLRQPRSKRVKQPALIRMRTNLGSLTLELYPEYAPRTVYNFVKLAEQGYYNGVKFHRNIKYFMIQGGDPTGTGRGGSSYYGKPFVDEYNSSPLSHDVRGVVSMANKGTPTTNTSQFFILYRAKPQLDKRHTVFGKVVDGIEVLDKMEAAPTDPQDHPVNDIVILDMLVVFDPFKEHLAKLKADDAVAAAGGVPESDAVDHRKLLDEKVTWSGKLVGANNNSAVASTAPRRGVGKYL